MDRKKTGENLNAIRQERKISIEMLAKKIGVSYGTAFNHIKNGITTIDFLLMYCEALGCEPTDILDGCTDLSRYTVREDVASLYPYNIAIQLFINTPYPTDEKISEALEQMYKVYIPSFLEAISNLTEREQKVLWCRYKHDMTLEQTGKKFNVTKERIRQIEKKALRKLRHPRYSKHYIFDTLDKAFKAVSEKTRVENENERLREKLKSVGEVMVNEAVNPVVYQPISIDRLDLSVRAYNCLKRAGVKTLDDLKNMSYLQLTRLRNMGKKSATEIVESARKFGIDIT